MRFGTAVPIAAGATGRVVRAFDHERGEEVALKLLHRDDPAWVQRMLREAEVQMRLDHPHICRVYGTGRLGEQSWIAMRLVEGSTLDQAAEDLSDRDKAALLAQVADAIAYAHAQGVVHRDLKPSNILVERRDGAPHAVVVDFGLVRVVDAPELTRTGQLLGTPGYMAPEQATAAASVDGRADIFSLGVIAFELFAGRRPFSGESAAEILLHTLRHEPPSLQSLRPDVDPALSRIVRQCLETDPDWRYADAGALRDDLLAFAEGRRVQARSDGRLHRLRRFTRRHPWRAALGSAVALLLVGVLALAVHSSWYARQQSVASQRHTEFGAAVENAMRLEYMKPAHDVAAVRSRLRARIDAFDERLSGNGPARRAGELALGRALATLGEPERALARLRAAADAGEDGHELHAALGQVLLRLYFDGLQQTTAIANPELRQAAVAELDTRYRDAAAVHLRRAGSGDDAQAAQMQALLAWLHGDTGDAEQQLVAAAEALAWPVDALLLAGDLAVADGIRLGLAGDTEAALARWRAARARFDHAAGIARSHPGVAAAQCLVGGSLVTLKRHGADIQDAEYTSAMDQCDRAIALDSASSRAHASKAQAMADLGLLLRIRGEWDDAAFEPAIAAARRAVALDPGSVQAMRALGALLTQRLYWRLEQGQDGLGPLAEEAIAVLAGAQAADPASAHGAMVLANAYRGASRAAIAAGQDGERFLVAAEQALQAVADRADAPLILEVHLVDNQTWRGFEAYMAGKPADALLEGSLARARRLYQRAPQHPRVGPVYAMAAWTLADYRFMTGGDAEDLASEAVGVYRAVLARPDAGVVTLFNAVGGMQLLAAIRNARGESIAAHLAELEAWLGQLAAGSGEDAPIDVQLAAFHRLVALEAIRNGDDPLAAFATARVHLEQALESPIDAREAALTLAMLGAEEHAWRRAHQRFDPALAAGDVAAVQAAIARHPDLALLKCEAARMVAALPASHEQLRSARTWLDQGLAQMPLLSKRYAELAERFSAAAAAGTGQP